MRPCSHIAGSSSIKADGRAPPCRPVPRASPVPYRVSIVETDQPSAVRGVKCERIAQPVGPVHCHFGLEHDELHPMSDLVVEHRLAIEVEQSVEPSVTLSLLR